MNFRFACSDPQILILQRSTHLSKWKMKVNNNWHRKLLILFRLEMLELTHLWRCLLWSYICWIWKMNISLSVKMNLISIIVLEPPTNNQFMLPKQDKLMHILVWCFCMADYEYFFLYIYNITELIKPGLIFFFHFTREKPWSW